MLLDAEVLSLWLPQLCSMDKEADNNVNVMSEDDADAIIEHIELPQVVVDLERVPLTKVNVLAYLDNNKMSYRCFNVTVKVST